MNIDERVEAFLGQIPIETLSERINALVDALAPGGRMVHVCPNYIVPYEPHFQIIVMKFWQSLGKVFFSRKISSKMDL